MPNGATDRTPDVGNILLTMGDTASLVDSLEIQPMRRMTEVPAVRTIVRQEAAPRPNPNAPPGVVQPPPPPTFIANRAARSRRWRAEPRRGTLGADYHDVAIDIAARDTVLLMTDGFPELQNESGQQLGYAAAVDEFTATASGATADGVIASLAAAAKRWNGERPPNDDVTFVVVRAKAA